jgi:quinoprotein glucose dehydrogenase
VRPIWPIPETPVPHVTNSPGEVVSPTQPIPTAPPPFTEHSFTAADVNPYILTDQQRAAILARLAESRDEGAFTPIGYDSVVHMPGNQGGANWGATSANPTNGSVYVISYNFPTLIKLVPPGQGRQGGGGRGVAATGTGRDLYAANCASCHGANRAGVNGLPTLVGVEGRLNAAQMRTMIRRRQGADAGVPPAQRNRSRCPRDFLCRPPTRVDVLAEAARL